jgi:beta-carotene 3-hydroxylase
MEGITWLTHRFVMHGFLWILHKDHHQVRPGVFEKNDLFAFIFAVPSFLMIYFGTYDHIWWLQSIGFGIMLYGFAYFMVHDVIIHQRFWFPSNHIHVRASAGPIKCTINRYPRESFGFLLVSKNTGIKCAAIKTDGR